MLIAQQTLSEQLQLTEHEIARRRELFQIWEADCQLLSGCRQYIGQRLDDIVESFYLYMLQIREADLLVGDAETLRRLKASMKHYIAELFDGEYGSDHVNRRLRIGKVHKRSGVPPKLYVSMVMVLQDLLTDELTAYSKSEGVTVNVEQLKNALRKVMMFDMELVFDTYISNLASEIASANSETERYAASLEETVAERTKQLEEISRRDPLTDLYNRKSFEEILRRDLALAQREFSIVTLVYIDLNGFKQVNDEKGHSAGDQILVSVGQLLVDALRTTDVVCRCGGDEFCVIMPSCSAAKAKERIQLACAQLPSVGCAGVTFSVGIAQAGPNEFPTLEEMVQAADVSMYKAKEFSRESFGNYVEIAEAC